MKSRIKRLGGLLALGILSVSAGIVFDVSFRVINILSRIGYVGISIYFILKIPKRFGLTKKEWFFDELQTKWEIRGIIIGVVLFLLGIFGGWKLYQSNIVNVFSLNGANRMSKHIRLEQGKTPCISIGKECE